MSGTRNLFGSARGAPFRLLLLLILGLFSAAPAPAQPSGVGASPSTESEPAEPAAPGAEGAPAPLAEDEPEVEDFSQPMGPPDDLNRGTPRGSMYGFITAARESDYERAAEFLDLRRLAPGVRGSGPELARQLKTVLDQTLWVDFASLSDLNEGFADDGLPAWQDRLGAIETADGSVTLLLQRVPRKGDEVRIWKVSAATVARTGTLYQEFGPVWIEAWLPPVFFEVQLLNLALWQWLGLFVLLAGAWLASGVLAGAGVRLIAALLKRGDEGLDDRIVNAVRSPVRLAIIVAIAAFGQRFFGLDTPVAVFLGVVEHVLWVVSAAWLTFRVIDIAVLGFRLRAERLENSGLVPVLVPFQRISKVLIVVIGTLGVLGTLGVNITAAVAGLGVGGIAVALAAQRTLENLFGGVSLFADRPVRVGDFFRYGDSVGTVEEIGLRSTRVRTLDRTVVTVPNAEFSNLRLENFAKRDRIRLWTLIGVRYETTPDQLRYTLAQLKRVLVEHPRVTDDPCRVRFVGFGAYSLDIEVAAYVDTADWDEFLAIREDVYLSFMEVIDEAGTGFAFPSSTTYVGRDDGLDAEQIRSAEGKIAEWRENGALPFPNFPEDLERELKNTAAWPPQGSADVPKG